MTKTKLQQARCVAPIDEVRLCGAPATETRIVEYLSCPVCPEHAAQLDRDAEESRRNRTRG